MGVKVREGKATSFSGHLLDCLVTVPDPCRAKGRRHPLSFILALAACPVPAGAKSLKAIAEWAAGAPA
ncbi:transposase family protein [Streptomyces aquilus]|uniref:Transposase family protein n=1 Tax=Streptomyces aquilus TaxID=2548456 RepID=A0A3S5HMH3_9ACTN|nr:transposase family protein [Streptomyces aquilus]AZP15112.1 transposase family protein [Streptomyces aquilus]